MLQLRSLAWPSPGPPVWRTQQCEEAAWPCSALARRHAEKAAAHQNGAAANPIRLFECGCYTSAPEVPGKNSGNGSILESSLGQTLQREIIVRFGTLYRAHD